MVKTMQDYAKQYQHENRNKGKVVKVTDYSLVFESNSSKEGKTETHIVYESYFMEF